MTLPMTPCLLGAADEGDAIWSKDHWFDLSSNFYQMLNVNSSLISLLVYIHI
jgi:hypothetical protein